MLQTDVSKDTTPGGVEIQHPQLHSKIETFLCGRILDTNATAAVEQVLFDQALRHDLVYAVRRMADSLITRGLSVELQYCTSQTHGHPVPFLIVRDSSGEVVIPNSVPSSSTTSGSEFRVIDCEESPCGEHRLNASREPNSHRVTRRKAAIVVIPERNS